MTDKQRHFSARGRSLTLGERTLVMGIVNVTPDSFSDGGETFDTNQAIARALEFDRLGVDIIDIGGLSTRPGSDPVDLDEEIRRIEPVIKDIADKVNALISIDTYRYEVAECALQSGAHIVNDISAGTFSESIIDLVVDYKAGIILMHIKGTPKIMQVNPHYDDLIGEIKSFLTNATDRCIAAGISYQQILVDPGIGFGKTLDHNLTLIRQLRDFHNIGAGVLVGVSRKSFLGHLTGLDVNHRLPGTLVAVTASILHGADVVRVHDVEEVLSAVKVADALR